MSASIEAALRLEIAQYQEQIARAKGEAAKLREKLEAESKGMKRAVMTVDEALERARQRGEQLRAVNPWTTASAGAVAYAKIIEERIARNLKLDQAAAAAAAPVTSANQAMRNQAAVAARYRQATAGSSRGGSSGGGLQLGGVAMQAQDIAVQLQMGTKASIVLAQQGSQILSYFGAGGAVVGGVIAVGGAFYAMAEKSREAFNAMKADADGFEGKMKAALTGSSLEITSFFSEVRAGVSSAYKEIESLQSGWSGITARITQLFGGPSVAQREQAANALAIQKANALAGIQQALLETSGKEVRIAELKAAGQDKAADAMQRQLDLQREIARIQASDLTPEAKAKLAADATERSRLAGIDPSRAQRAKEEAAQNAEQLRKLKEDAGLSAEGMLPDAERLAAMRARLGVLMDNARMRNVGTRINSVQDMGAAAAKSGFARPVEEYQKALALQKEITALEKSMADDKAQEEKNAQRIKDARAALDLEIKIAKEQESSGKNDNDTIQKFRDEMNVMQLTAQMQEQLKVSAAEALKLATQKVAAERAAADAIKAQAEAEKQKNQLYNRQELAAQMRAEGLRAAGRDKEAAALERRIRIVQDAKRIEAATGLDAAKAMQLAERRERLRAKDDRDGRSGRPVRDRIDARIEGGREEARARAKQRMLDNYYRRDYFANKQGPRGVDEFWALQRGEVGDLGRGRFSGLGAQVFGQQHEQNAQKQNGRPPADSRELEELRKIKEAIDNLIQ